MNTYTSLCQLWNDDAALAADVGASELAVQKWRLRDKIPPGWWEAVVEAAERRGFQGVTLELLASIAAQKRGAA